MASHDNIIEEVYVDGAAASIHRAAAAAAYRAHRTSYISFSAESTTLAFGGRYVPAPPPPPAAARRRTLSDGASLDEDEGEEDDEDDDEEEVQVRLVDLGDRMGDDADADLGFKFKFKKIKKVRYTRTTSSKPARRQPGCQVLALERDSIPDTACSKRLA
jgi:hypothetical protein